MTIGFTASLRRNAEVGVDSFELKFVVTIYPQHEPQWMIPFIDECYVLARELGYTGPSCGDDFERMHGRVQLRWNGELSAGFRLPLVATTTWSDVAEVAKRHGCDRTKALQLLAEAGWQKYVAPKARELVFRELVRQELLAARLLPASEK